jgi:hypothetical protein
VGVVRHCYLADDSGCNLIACFQQFFEAQYRPGRPQGSLPCGSVAEKIQEAGKNVMVKGGVCKHECLWYYIVRTEVRDLKRATPNMPMVST